MDDSYPRSPQWGCLPCLLIDVYISEGFKRHEAQDEQLATQHFRALLPLYTNRTSSSTALTTRRRFIDGESCHRNEQWLLERDSKTRTSAFSSHLHAVHGGIANKTCYCSVGVFATLTNSYALVSIGASENFYR